MSEDDEALARKLQEELNAEFSTSNFDSLLEQQNQMEADLALAKKLLEEEEKALKSNGNKTSQNSTSIGGLKKNSPFSLLFNTQIFHFKK